MGRESCNLCDGAPSRARRQRITSYDDVLYPQISHSGTHPDKLATVACLLGMTPVPVDGCRVLELGCASGGNLIPMAVGLPASEFVGVDSSHKQIAQGQAAIAALKFSNVELRQLDILDIGADFGNFDYIIAHGVFSWVRPVVQDQVLRICSRNLSPNGVALVSYNVYPGWHFLGMIREMMLYHVRNVIDPREKAASARKFLGLLAEVASDDSVYGGLLKAHSRFLDGEFPGKSLREDALLLHDELEEINDPVYFSQFAERAAGHGLQYLSEVEFQRPASHLAAQTYEKLLDLAEDLIEFEQYLDFLCNKTFRQTLLCHADIPLDRSLNPDLVAGFFVSSRAKSVAAKPDVGSGSVEKFRGYDGATLSIDHPNTKAAMLFLAKTWPAAVPFTVLLSQSYSYFHSESAPGQDDTNLGQDAQLMCYNLLKAYTYSPSLIDLHTCAPRLSLNLGECPLASPWARFQAQHTDMITNLRHERVILDAIDRFLIVKLDGAQDKPALLDALAHEMNSGELVVLRDAEAVEEAGSSPVEPAKILEEKLHQLAQAALLLDVN